MRSVDVDKLMEDFDISLACADCKLFGKCGSSSVSESKLCSAFHNAPTVEMPVDEIPNAIDFLEKEFDYCGGPSGIAWMRGYRSGIAAAIRILQKKEWIQDESE